MNVMNIIFLNHIKDNEKEEVTNAIRREESLIRTFTEREPFMIKQKRAIIGSVVEENIIVEKIVPLVV